MKKKFLLIAFSVVLFLGMSYKTSMEYMKLNEARKQVILKESQAIASYMIAFRRTYQDIFIQENMEIDPEKIRLFPTKTLEEVNKRFLQDINSSIEIRTVSDHPTHYKNMANELEMEAIAYFKNYPEKKDMFSQKEDKYYYTRPLIITKKCLY